MEKVEQCNPTDGEIDWLTGDYTYKRERLIKALSGSEKDSEVI